MALILLPYERSRGLIRYRGWREPRCASVCLIGTNCAFGRRTYVSVLRKDSGDLMATKKRSEALILKILARKRGPSIAGKILGSRASKAFVDAQRLQRVQHAFEKARHGKNLFGLEDAS